jgi:hypothetical protein
VSRDDFDEQLGDGAHIISVEQLDWVLIAWIDQFQQVAEGTEDYPSGL